MHYAVPLARRIRAFTWCSNRAPTSPAIPPVSACRFPADPTPGRCRLGTSASSPGKTARSRPSGPSRATGSRSRREERWRTGNRSFIRPSPAISLRARLRRNGLQALQGDGDSGGSNQSLRRDPGSGNLRRRRPRRRCVGQRFLQRGPPGSDQSMDLRCSGRLAREDRSGWRGLDGALLVARSRRPRRLGAVPDELYRQPALAAFSRCRASRLRLRRRSGPASTSIPAIAPDGTIYTVSRAHFNDRYALSRRGSSGPDARLEPRRFAGSSERRLRRRSAAERRRLEVAVPARTAASTRPPTTVPAGRVSDLARPRLRSCFPDGGVLIGAFTSYNYSSGGHLFKFSAGGRAACDLRLRLGHHAGRLRSMTEPIRSCSRTITTVGSYCGRPDASARRRLPGTTSSRSMSNLSVEWRPVPTR